MAIDMYLKIPGVDGESKAKGFEKHIELESVNWGGVNPTSGRAPSGGGGAGRVELNDVHFTKSTDKSSTLLFYALASGKHYDDATFTFRKQGEGQQPYLIVKLFHPLVSAANFSAASGGSSVPNESYSMNYAKIEVQYKAQKPDGSLEGPVFFKYDVATTESKK